MAKKNRKTGPNWRTLQTIFGKRYRKKGKRGSRGRN